MSVFHLTMFPITECESTQFFSVRFSFIKSKDLSLLWMLRKRQQTLKCYVKKTYTRYQIWSFKAIILNLFGNLSNSVLWISILGCRCLPCNMCSPSPFYCKSFVLQKLDPVSKDQEWGQGLRRPAITLFLWESPFQETFLWPSFHLGKSFEIWIIHCGRMTSIVSFSGKDIL